VGERGGWELPVTAIEPRRTGGAMSGTVSGAGAAREAWFADRESGLNGRSTGGDGGTMWAWIVPVLAAVVAGVMGWQVWSQRGPGVGAGCVAGAAVSGVRAADARGGSAGQAGDEVRGDRAGAGEECARRFSAGDCSGGKRAGVADGGFAGGVSRDSSGGGEGSRVVAGCADGGGDGGDRWGVPAAGAE